MALAEKEPYSRLKLRDPWHWWSWRTFLGWCSLPALCGSPPWRDWSQEEATLTPYFSKTMPHNRYQLIWRFLHFTDSRQVDGNDPLHKVHPVLDLLLSKFKEMYQPAENISIDKGMLLWRGRLRFRVYCPGKQIRYQELHPVWVSNCGSPCHLQDTVAFLIDGLEGYGYRLGMDNYYNSVEMCRLLLGHKIHYAGTLGVNRGEPKSIKDVTVWPGSGENVSPQRRRNGPGMAWQAHC